MRNPHLWELRHMYISPAPWSSAFQSSSQADTLLLCGPAIDSATTTELSLLLYFLILSSCCPSAPFLLLATITGVMGAPSPGSATLRSSEKAARACAPISSPTAPYSIVASRPNPPIHYLPINAGPVSDSPSRSVLSFQIFRDKQRIGRSQTTYQN